MPQDTTQSSRSSAGDLQALAHPQHNFLNRVVKSFLESHLSVILILLSVVAGVTALWVTPREEDPQIVVPLADVFVQFPGRSAAEVEQLVATPLEKILFQIDGVEYVYSMSKPDLAIITVRFHVGQDRERSLVKLFKKMDENLDAVPPGVAGWVVKPVEIDDVPIVTLTLRPCSDLADAAAAPDSFALRRVAEELVQRLSAIEDLSRAYVIGGQPRQVRVQLDVQRMAAFRVAPLQVQQAISSANVALTAGDFSRADQALTVEVGRALTSAAELRELVVAVWNDQPVFLKDVARIIDGPAETTSYVRHGWGPARDVEQHRGAAGTLLQALSSREGGTDPAPAVTIALAKKKGTNAVWVAQAVLDEAARLRQHVVPDDVEIVITRNFGLTADEKVNELVEALVVAVILVIAVLTFTLGWRESLIVAVAVPVVFGLTLAVNLMLGFSINRVTLFALILSMGLLVDDPIVDVENIVRHFVLRKKATRRIVLEAIAEIRPPLITATLAVIVSFLPMFFITGMMGPYMRPMALNVPVTMLMSMVVAFTITPWLAYHMLKRQYGSRSPQTMAAQPPGEKTPDQLAGASAGSERPLTPALSPGQGEQETFSRRAREQEDAELAALRQSLLWRLFHPLLAPLLRHRWLAWSFLLVMGLLTVAAAGLAVTRHVPLKMLPFDNKNELLLVLDLPEGTTLQRSDAAVREFEAYLQSVNEVVDLTSYVGLASPMDFNGMVRHYYLRQGEHLAEVRINLVPKKSRAMQSHAIGLRLRDDLTAIAHRHGAALKIVETPPGPPVIATLVAEVYGQPHHEYTDLLTAAQTVRRRLAAEPGVVDVDDITESPRRKLVFIADQEKAALAGVSVSQIADSVRLALAGSSAGVLRDPNERNPLHIELRLPRAERSSPADLAHLHVMGAQGQFVPLAELGRWQEMTIDQTIYHKNLRRVAYVFADTAGRAPAEAVVDILADVRSPSPDAPTRHVAPPTPRPLAGRTFFAPGSAVPWSLPPGIELDFAGEGEWQITLDVFRDLGLAFGAALVGVYILLTWQTGSFVIPLVIMLAIPLTILGVMPGFWLLKAFTGGSVAGYADPVFFTATGMIGMIALSGIVTRQSVLIIDFVHLAVARGRSLFDAIIESCVVRLRPIGLTAGTAALAAVPITIDPIFSGLAWSLIFGLVASTLFTLLVIPVAYWLLYARKPGHGLPASHLED